MKFEIYKRGQGKYTRLGTSAGLAIIIGLGCLRLYTTLSAASWEVTARTQLWISTMVPAALFVVLAIGIYWLVNKNSIADFMIAGEGEMKKVSWSSRKEIAVSTSVVIIVVVLMAILLGATDVVLRIIFSWLIG
ncbi:MAG: preprotein translocase subunit SecE [Phycisphaerae bacterium]|nr:preprotein translocase subunit SecE [Phycisphaerae bacterium]